MSVINYAAILSRAYEWRKSVYQEAIELYGTEMQRAVAIEEMTELSKALIKEYRGKEDAAAIAEEMADVIVTLEQQMLIHDNAAEVLAYVQTKVERLLGDVMRDKNTWSGKGNK